MKNINKLIYLIVASLIGPLATAQQQENWPGFEGGNLHINSSNYNVEPSSLGVLWKREFNKIIPLTNAWSYCTPDGNYGSRNLTVTNGYIPIVAYDGPRTPSNNSFNHLGYVTILNRSTGRTENVITATIADGPRHCNADASDVLRGLAVMNWDAKTNFLFIMNGGDGSGFTAYSPLKNKDSYQFGMVQNGSPAYPLRPEAQDAVYPTPGPNETSFFEVDPQYPLICYMSGTHSSTSKVLFGQKYLGQGISANLQNFPANPFAKWSSVLSGNKRFFGMGPLDETNQKGLIIWGFDMTWKDNTKHGWDTMVDFDFIQLDTAFVYNVSSQSTISRESYNEIDGTYRNKAMLIDGKALWVAWKPGKAQNSELLYCDDSGIQKFDLGIAAGSLGQNVWPHLSLAQTGGKKYIVYYAGISDNDSKIAVFDADSKVLKWNYNISSNHASLPKSPLACYNDNSQMIVTGKYAYVGWVDVKGTDAYLSLLSFDITKPSPVPVLKKIPLDFSATKYKKSYLTDLASTNGIMYALITMSDTIGGNVWTSHTSNWQAQYIYALAEPDTISPTRPSKFFASQITATTSTLNWTPSEDKVGVKYNIYQDGKIITYTQDTTVKVLALTTGKTYQFILEPVDFAGNIGAKDTLSVTTGNFVNGFLSQSSGEISVFPNPAHSLLNIETQENLERINISDVTGKIVLERPNLNGKNLTIPVQELSPGFYIITVFSSVNKAISVKFVKE